MMNLLEDIESCRYWHIYIYVYKTERYGIFAMDIYVLYTKKTLSSLSLMRLLLLPKGNAVWGTGHCSIRLVPSLHAFQACKGILLDRRVTLGLSAVARCCMRC